MKINKLTMMYIYVILIGILIYVIIKYIKNKKNLPVSSDTSLEISTKDKNNLKTGGWLFKKKEELIAPPLPEPITGDIFLKNLKT